MNTVRDRTGLPEFRICFFPPFRQEISPCELVNMSVWLPDFGIPYVKAPNRKNRHFPPAAASAPLLPDFPPGVGILENFPTIHNIFISSAIFRDFIRKSA